MNAERWQKIDELFQAALARAPEFRPAFLQEACKGDTALYQEVQQLLVSFDAAASFLEAPVGETFAGKSTQSPSLTNGQRLAHYEILSQLGAGGMGEVYLARDLKLDREIALKLLPAQFAADPERVSRFAREARAASALNHPNIIVIHEVGEESGKHFIVTEYIAGDTLRQKLNHGRLAPAEVVSIARQVASALAAAHQAGLIHRDIKPENIMIRPDGLVKVLDFGLAKHLREVSDPPRTKSASGTASPETDPDLLIGSLNYLSPEQVRHEKLDARTDLFSLGVVCYEMLSGMRPFAGATPDEVCKAILSSDPLPIADDRFWPIVSKALAKQRDARYQSAGELLADLSRELQPNRLRAVPALIALAVVIIGGIWFWNSRSGSQSPGPDFKAAIAQKLTDIPGQELFPHLSPDGQRFIFSAAREGNWDIYVQAVGEHTATNLTAGSESAEFQATYSPDGQQIAFRSSRDGGGVFLMNGDGTNVTKLIEMGFNPAWSPDGSELAVSEDISWDYEARNTYPSASRLWAINLATRQRRLVTEHDAVQPDWSPHGKRIAYWGEQKGGHRDIWTVAAAGDAPVPVTDDAHVDWNPVWSSDGAQLYFLSNRGGEMNLWRVAIDENTGALRGTPEPATLPSNNCQHVSLARNGSALVYGQTTRSENLWQASFDPERGQMSPASPLTQGLKRYAMFSLAPDEKSFVYLARGEPQQDLFIAELNGNPLRRLTDDAAQDIVPRWSPDGQWIAFLSDRSGKYEIWKMRPDGSGLAQMTDEPGREVIAPVWSPDSRHLLYEIRNVNAYLIDTDRAGAEQKPQPLPTQQPPSFIPWDWSPDGNYLVGWQHSVEWGIVIYSFSDQRYQRITKIGSFPVWSNDSRHLIFRENGELYFLDRVGGEPRKTLSLKGSDIGAHQLSRDGRRLYFSAASNEADIWLLKLK